MLGRGPVPERRLEFVRVAADAGLDHLAGGVLRARVTLPRGAQEPAARLLGARRAADGVAQHDRGAVLGIDVAERRAAPEPRQGHDVVALHAFAVAVHLAQVGGGTRLALGGGAAKPFERRGDVRRTTSARAIERREPHLGVRVADVGGGLQRVHLAGRVRAVFVEALGRVGMAFGRRQPVPTTRRIEILRHTAAGTVELSELELRRRQPEASGLAQQARGVFLILGHALAVEVEEAQVIRRHGVTQIGRPAVPARRLRRVARHALAEPIDMAEMQLGDREILLGGEPEQRDASRRVGGDAEPLEVHVGEVGLGARVVLVGRLAIPLQRGRVVLRDAAPHAIQVAQVGLCARIALSGERQPFLVGGHVVAPVVGTDPGAEVGHRRPGERDREKRGERRNSERDDAQYQGAVIKAHRDRVRFSPVRQGSRRRCSASARQPGALRR